MEKFIGGGLCRYVFIFAYLSTEIEKTAVADTHFLGEYDCRLDAKGRFILPTALRKQVPQEAGEKFVINRGYEKHLVIYPINEWKKINEELNKLNQGLREVREFIRYFLRGAMEIEFDNAGRLLIKKSLIEYAGLDKDLILLAHTNKIEVWDKDEYDNSLSNEPSDFAALAEKVWGGKGIGE